MGGIVVRVPLPPESQLAQLRRFAARLRGPTALVVVAPVSVAAVMTTLLGHGVRIPQQAEMLLVQTSPSASLVWPVPGCYEASMEGFVKHITRAAVHFFQTGAVPSVRKTLPMEFVKSQQS